MIIREDRVSCLFRHKEMKAAIYIKTRIIDQGNNSPTIQLSSFAYMKGWQSEIFSETLNDMGSQNVKKELLSRLYRNEFDVLMVYKFSDWSVRLSDLLKEINLVMSKGKRFFSYSENFDSESPTGKIYLMTLSALKEFKHSFYALSKEEDPGFRFLDNIQGNDNISNPVTRAAIRKGFGNTSKTQFDLIDLHEACAYTGYSQHTIYQMTSRHMIPFIKRPGGRKIFFSRKALENWLINGSD